MGFTYMLSTPSFMKEGAQGYPLVVDVLVVCVTGFCLLVLGYKGVSNDKGRAMTLKSLYSAFGETPMILLHLRFKVLNTGAYHALVGLKDVGIIHLTFEHDEYPVDVEVDSAMRAVRCEGKIILEPCDDFRTGLTTLPSDIQCDLAEVLAH